MLKAVKVRPDDPFRFDFVVDRGNLLMPSEPGSQEALKQSTSTLVKYFLAGLTVPEKDMWVNLSPCEQDRMIPLHLGLTEMGRDLVAQDYALKQITASLINPEGETGKKFWKRFYEEAAREFGTTDVPVNTLHKVWIVPDKTVIYENVSTGAAYVMTSTLKVLVEQDYLALEKDPVESLPEKMSNLPDPGYERLFLSVMKEIVIPELSREVNAGESFVILRQIYNSLILAGWYKKRVRDSILKRVYSDKNKVAGICIKEPVEIRHIYGKYLNSFRNGVYNMVREETNENTRDVVPKKYFSGGIRFDGRVIDSAEIVSGASGPAFPVGHQMLEAGIRLAPDWGNRERDGAMGETPRWNRLAAVIGILAVLVPFAARGQTPLAAEQTYERYILPHFTQDDPEWRSAYTKLLQGIDPALRQFCADTFSFSNWRSLINQGNEDISEFVRFTSSGETSSPESQLARIWNDFTNRDIPPRVLREPSRYERMVLNLLYAEFLKPVIDAPIPLEDKKRLIRIFVGEIKDIESPESLIHLFNFAGNKMIYQIIRPLIVKNHRIIPRAVLAVSPEDLLKTDYFNMIAYAIMNHLLSADDEKNMFGGVLHGALEEENVDQWMWYMLSVRRLLGQMPQDRDQAINDAYAEDLGRLKRFLDETRDAPSYQRMKRTRTLNVRLYNPWYPEQVQAYFHHQGYTIAQDGQLYTLSKDVNGIKVTIYQDPTKDHTEYKGNIFEYMSAPDIDVITYLGHTGMGASLAFALDQLPQRSAPQADEKLFMILSCGSMANYYASILKHFPTNSFVGTRDNMYVEDGGIALLTILEGMARELSWREIKARVAAEVEKDIFFPADSPVRMHKVSPGYRQTLFNFPGDGDRITYMQGAVDDSAAWMDGVYLPYGGDALAQENDSFELNEGETTVVNSAYSKAQSVLGQVRYFFTVYDYLSEFVPLLRFSGFQQLRESGAGLVLGLPSGPVTPGQNIPIAFNVGYQDASKSVQVMMALHELNMYFSRIKAGGGENWKPDTYDILRSLQMVFEYAFRFHQQKLFPEFLRKYHLPDIDINTLKKTVLIDSYHEDVSERVRAIQEIFKQLAPGGLAAPGEETLRARGLLSLNEAVPGSPRYALAARGNKFRQAAVDRDGAMHERETTGGIDFRRDSSANYPEGPSVMRFDGSRALWQQLKDVSGFNPCLLYLKPLENASSF